ncbi:MAG: hypothetical protein AAF716_09540 [Cyanobacteria bacterium P01_D01_bin.1]
MDNQNKPEIGTNGGFWTTLPGVLTGVAGVIGAITALILGLKEVGLIGQDSPPSPSTSTSETSPALTASPTSSTDSSLPPATQPPIVSPTPTVEQSPNSTSTQPKSAWEFMGAASTGESISVNTNSITKSGNSIKFEYKIGDESISANADCAQNKWYAENYDWYSPQSKATQDMMNFVCSF